MIVDNLEFRVQRTGNAAAKGTDRLGRSLRNLSKSSGIANKGLSGLLHTVGRLAKMMMLRQMIRALMKAIGEGLENVYKFNSLVGGELSAALDKLKSASVQATGAIGSAFGELLATLSPILIAILNLITRVANAFSQLMAVLGGRSTYTKAIASSEKWADATSQGAKSAKEWKNQLMGFDEINRLEEPSDSSGSGGGSSPYDGGFELAPAVNKWAEEMRRITMDWWNSLNLDPIINAWDRLRTSVGEFVDLVDGALYWAYTEVLLPLGTWTIEEGLPAVMHMLASAVELLTSSLKALQPYALWVYEEWIKPFADWIGDHFISAMWRLQDTFVQLRMKIEEAKSLGEFLHSLSFGEAVLVSLATAVATVVTAFAAWKAITSVVSLVSGAIGLLTSPLGIITLLVLGGIALYQSWEDIERIAKKVWKVVSEWVAEKLEAIHEKFEAFHKWIYDHITKPLEDMVDKVKEKVDKFKEKMEEAFGGTMIGKLLGFKDTTNNTKDSVTRDIETMAQSGSSNLGSFGEALDETNDKIWNVYNDGSLLGSLASSFEDLAYRAHGAIQHILDGLGHIIGQCIDALRGLNDVANARAAQNEADGSQYLPGFATGGFPDEGDLFMAREGGMPELVGRIGNRTAVASNDQIIQGISAGVFNAVVSAMGQSSGNDKHVDIYLDGALIAKSTTKYQKQYARTGTM